MITAPTASYQGHRFPAAISAPAVWLYCRFSRSYRAGEELLAARGITVGDQSQNAGLILLGSLPPKEGRADPGTEGAAADRAAIARLFTAMHRDIALAGLAPCRAGGIMAELGVRIHGESPEVRYQSFYADPPLLLRARPHDHGCPHSYLSCCAAQPFFQPALSCRS
jgi:hypothetical protein